MADEMKACARCGAESRRAAKSSDRLCVQCAGTEAVAPSSTCVIASSAIGVESFEEARQVAERLLDPKNSLTFGDDECPVEQTCRCKGLHPAFQLVLEALEVHENFSLPQDMFYGFGVRHEDVIAFAREYGLRLTKRHEYLEFIFSRIPPAPRLDPRYIPGTNPLRRD